MNLKSQILGPLIEGQFVIQKAQSIVLVLSKLVSVQVLSLWDFRKQPPSNPDLKFIEPFLLSC